MRHPLLKCTLLWDTHSTVYSSLSPGPTAWCCGRSLPWATCLTQPSATRKSWTSSISAVVSTVRKAALLPCEWPTLVWTGVYGGGGGGGWRLTTDVCTVWLKQKVSRWLLTGECCSATFGMHVHYLCSSLGPEVTPRARVGLLSHQEHGLGCCHTKSTGWVAVTPRARVGLLSHQEHGLGCCHTKSTDWVAVTPRARTGLLSHQEHGLGCCHTKSTDWVAEFKEWEESRFDLQAVTVGLAGYLVIGCFCCF